MTPRAFLLDMDGVLIDAQAIHRRAFAEAVRRVTGLEVTEADERRLEGRPTKVKLDLLGVRDTEKARLVSALKQAMTLSEAARYPLDLDRVSVLSRARAAGIQTACVTNSIRQTTEKFLTSAGLFRHIDIIITNQDVLNPKPHPDGYMLALHRLGVAPEEAVVFEDTPIGLAAARGAKARVCPTSFEHFVEHASLFL